MSLEKNCFERQLENVTQMRWESEDRAADVGDGEEFWMGTRGKE